MSEPSTEAASRGSSGDVPKDLQSIVDGPAPLAEKIRSLISRCNSEEYIPDDLDWRLAEVGDLLETFWAGSAASSSDGGIALPLPFPPTAGGAAARETDGKIALPRSFSPAAGGAAARETEEDCADAFDAQIEVDDSSSSLIVTQAMEEISIWAIVGDLHGDFPALASLLRALFDTDLTETDAESIHIVFLGDLLDRGAKDFQVLHLVLCLRSLLGPRLLLLRGNHEEIALDDEDRMRATVAENRGTHGVFARRYRDLVERDLSRRLVSFFENLPHIAVLHNAQGRIGLVHGGIPPAFIFNRFSTLDEMIDVENARRALLWGRPFPFSPSAVDSRPDRFYKFTRFYREDADEFRAKFGLDILVRGHDAAEPGYESRWDGTLLTVFSSGAGAPRDLEDVGAYADDVVLPRYLVVDAASVFRGMERPAERLDIDAGIGVREVFQRDIVILLRSRFEADIGPDGVLTRTARAIHQRLRPLSDVSVHLLEGSGYEELADTELELLEPLGSVFDGVLDPVRLGRQTYVLRVLDDRRLQFFRWCPPGMSAESVLFRLSVAFGSEPIVPAALAACAAMIAEDVHSC